MLNQCDGWDEFNPLATLYHRAPQRRTEMGFPSATRTEHQEMIRLMQPGGLFSELHDHHWVETGDMGELKIRPGFSVRQLRFAERAGNPGLVSPLGFAFG